MFVVVPVVGSFKVMKHRCVNDAEAALTKFLKFWILVA